MSIAAGVRRQRKDSDKRLAAEMANPKVQVYNGDVAILTYNYTRA